MKNQAVLKRDENEKENEININGKDKPEIIKAGIHFISGLLASLFPAEYAVSPFAAAAVGAAEKEYGFLSFTGACLGYLLTRGLSQSVRYIILLSLVLVSKGVVTKGLKSINRKTVDAVFSSVFVLCIDAIFLLIGDFSAFNALITVSDALLCAVSVYFFSKSLVIFDLNKNLRGLSATDTACLVISLGILLCCFGGVSISLIYPAHIFAGLLILFCATYKGASAGSIVGIAVGAVLSLNPDMSHIFYMYALGGLLAGVFSPTGQYAPAVAFTAVSGVVLIFTGDFGNIYSLIECAVAGVAFSCIPSKWLSAAHDYLSKNGLRDDNEVNRQVAVSLRTAARTVEEITDIVSKVSERMDSIINPQLSRVYARIQHNVCADCEFKGICWNECFEETVESIERIAKGVGESGFSSDELPDGMKIRCSKTRKLRDEVEKEYRCFVSDTESKIKLDEMRGVVNDQFSSMARLLDDVSDRISNEKVFNETKSSAIRNILSENGIAVQSASYFENSSSQAVVEILFYEEAEKINVRKIAGIISHLTDKSFSQPEISTIDYSTVLTYRQKPQYEVKTGFYQIPYGENKICGDKAEILDDANGNTVAVISDGMGTGKRAAIDGTMTCSLMNKLLISGFTFDSALRIVNSALLIKSSDESLATVDAVCINNYSGMCSFRKAGAAQSYIRKKDKIITVSGSSLPVGILRDVEFAKEEIELSKGDIVLMVSDGVNEDSEKWISDSLLAWSTDNMQELASHIAGMAKLKNAGGNEDDITAIALKIK